MGDSWNNELWKQQDRDRDLRNQEDARRISQEQYLYWWGPTGFWATMAQQDRKRDETYQDMMAEQQRQRDLAADAQRYQDEAFRRSLEASSRSETFSYIEPRSWRERLSDVVEAFHTEPESSAHDPSMFERPEGRIQEPTSGKALDTDEPRTDDWRQGPKELPSIPPLDRDELRRDSLLGEYRDTVRQPDPLQDYRALPTDERRDRLLNEYREAERSEPLRSAAMADLDRKLRDGEVSADANRQKDAKADWDYWWNPVSGFWPMMRRQDLAQEDRERDNAREDRQRDIVREIEARQYERVRETHPELFSPQNWSMAAESYLREAKESPKDSGTHDGSNRSNKRKGGKRKPIETYEYMVTDYKEANHKSRVGDGLDGHELIPKAYLVAHGVTQERMDYNAAILLTPSQHAMVTELQRAAGHKDKDLLRAMTIEDVIDLNAHFLHKVGVPPKAITQVVIYALEQLPALQAAGIKHRDLDGT
ncbi:hypothetical protein ARTHRO9AX_220321 [Arthrobacter sp. 9AX]|uniref:hypothetical protein n=1 Tax=Arthrobacter sp. 9AX TaxID=2653131 RepID=UPI0012F41375|nr:hypothetical protein [Arthrobacter sp. 9AX]VXC23934.1 hypothetical protein ARTHRO9AX_220321 [Arthrobacter sp. 9AX]